MVEAITGIDHYKDWRGKYSCKKTAALALREIGSGTLYKTLISKFGLPVSVKQSEKQSEKGDIGYINKSCGIIIGRDTLFLSKEGYLLININELQYIFKVT